MFNESLKLQFIRDTRSGNDVSSLFISAKPYEEKFGKDLCAFTKDELQEFANNGIGVMESTKRSRLNLIKQYSEWCATHGVPGVCQISNSINTSDTSRIKDCMVANPAHLNMILDAAFRDVDRHTIDNVYRCFIWMAFFGIPQHDALSVFGRDVDFDRMEICCAGERFPIYRESVQVLRDCAELSQFRYEHDRSSMDGKFSWRDRADGQELLRGYTTENNLDSISFLFRKAINAARLKQNSVKFAIPKLSYMHVLASGRFYRMREREMMGIPVDFKAQIINEMIADGKHDPSDKKYLNRISVKACRMKMDYECWKAAF